MYKFYRTIKFYIHGKNKKCWEKENLVNTNDFNHNLIKSIFKLICIFVCTIASSFSYYLFWAIRSKTPSGANDVTWHIIHIRTTIVGIFSQYKSHPFFCSKKNWDQTISIDAAKNKKKNVRHEDFNVLIWFKM